MPKVALPVLLALSLWCSTSRLALAQTSPTINPPPATTKPNPKQAQHAEKVKAQVAKLGVGPGARIELTLRDKTKVKGYVNHADEDQFVVADGRTGITTRMAYAQVKAIRDEDSQRNKEIAIGIVLGLMMLISAGSLTGGP